MKTILAASAVAAGGVAATEALFRYLEPALPTHRLWYDTLPAVHLRKMRALGRVRGGIDVLFCGASVVHCGFDPAAVLRQGDEPLTGYNAGLHRGFVEIIGPWLEWAAIPILRPKVLVVGLSIADLNDNGTLQREEPRKYRGSLLGRRDVIGTLARRLEPRSAAFRNHRMLRSPRRLASAVAHRRAGTAAADVDVRASRVSLGAWGEWTGFHGREFLTTENMYEHIAHGALGDYRAGGEQVRIIEGWITRFRELVPEVVLSSVPLSTKLPEVLPHGDADMDDYAEVLRGIAARTGVPLLEPTPDLVDEDDFADFVHVNEKGMAKLSASVGEQLAEHLRPGVVPARRREPVVMELAG